MTPELVLVNCPLCDSPDHRPERVLRGYALVRCTRCDLVYANPRFPRQTLISGYDDEGEHADEIHITENLGDYYARRVTVETLRGFDRVLNRIEELNGGPGRILDFGCGAGWFVERASRTAAWDAHGVEIGSWAEAEANRRGLKNIHIGMLHDQNFADGQFDAIHSSQVFEHLDAPHEELRELRRILRPGGILYANVPNYASLSIRLGRDHFSSNYPMGHLGYFTPTTLRRLFEKAGFHVIGTATYGGLNWENILGREMGAPHDRNLVQEGPPPDPFLLAPDRTDGRPPRSGWRTPVRGFTDWLFYRQLQVGIELEIYAVRA